MSLPQFVSQAAQTRRRIPAFFQGRVDRFFWLSGNERRQAAELGEKCAEVRADVTLIPRIARNVLREKREAGVEGSSSSMYRYFFGISARELDPCNCLAGKESRRRRALRDLSLIHI